MSPKIVYVLPAPVIPYASNVKLYPLSKNCKSYCIIV